jgi:hypothetical protein
MALQPYMLGSSLDTIGNNMARNYGVDAQRYAAELALQAQQEQARNQYAIALQQALQSQQARQAQERQFNQELAYRNAALGQNQDFRNRSLTQEQQQFEANQNYLRDALRNQLEIARTGQDRNDPRVLAALIEQIGRSNTGAANLNAGIGEANSEARANAANLNARLNLLKQSAPAMGNKRESWLPWGPDENDEAKSYIAEQLAAMLQSAPPGVMYNSATEQFEISPIQAAQPGPISTTTAGAIPPELQRILQAIAGTSTSTNVNSPLTNAATPQITQPKFVPGRIYQQGDKSYRFDGTNFIEVVSGQ